MGMGDFLKVLRSRDPDYVNQRIADGRMAAQSRARATGGGEFDPNAIFTPSRTTLADSVKAIQQSGVLPQFTPLKGIGDEFFDSLFAQSERRLNEKFFEGDNSILARRSNDLKRRGIYGDGLGESAINDIFDSFGDELTDIQIDLNARKAEAQAQKELADRDQQNFIHQLLFGAAADESRAATDFDTKIFESQIKDRDSTRDFQAEILGQVGNTLGQELIDKDTRNVFRDIFGTQTGEALGYDFNQFVSGNAQQQPQANLPTGYVNSGFGGMQPLNQPGSGFGHSLSGYQNPTQRSGTKSSVLRY